MSLLVISHTSHYIRNQLVVGWGPTVRELDYLANAFGSLIHIAPLHKGRAPTSALPYTSSNVRIVPVSPGGGRTVREKILLLRSIPSYFLAIRQEISKADFIHVRCPANISLMACLLLVGSKTPPGWAKYAGNWQPNKKEAWSYTLQRYLLKYGWRRGSVTVNGTWPNQPPHVHAFLNPSFSMEELERAYIETANKRLGNPIQLLFVGRVEREKGVFDCLEILQRLHRQNLKCYLHFVGDGHATEELVTLATELDLLSFVRFSGWQPRTEIASAYTQAHFLLHPSTSSEGWPKVLSEAMAYKSIPLTYSVSSIPTIVKQLKSGLCFSPGDGKGIVEAIINFQRNPGQWEQMALQGQKSSSLFSYERYIESLNVMFHQSWGSSPRFKTQFDS